MPYMGTVPQEAVEVLARHLSKDNNGGRVLAEQLFRSEYSHDALVALFDGAKLSKEEQRKLPTSIVTGQRITAADVGIKEGS